MGEELGECGPRVLRGAQPEDREESDARSASEDDDDTEEAAV
jgi:hypothetical protein